MLLCAAFSGSCRFTMAFVQRRQSTGDAVCRHRLCFQVVEETASLLSQLRLLHLGEYHTPFGPSLKIEGNACLPLDHHVGLQCRQQCGELFSTGGSGSLPPGSRYCEFLSGEHSGGCAAGRVYGARQPVDDVLDVAWIGVVVFWREYPHAVGIGHNTPHLGNCLWCGILDVLVDERHALIVKLGHFSFALEHVFDQFTHFSIEARLAQ